MIPPRISPTQLGTRFGTSNPGHSEGSQSTVGRHVYMCWRKSSAFAGGANGAGHRHKVGVVGPVRAAMEHAIDPLQHDRSL